MRVSLRSMVVSVDDIDDPRLEPFAKLTDLQLRCRLEPRRGIFIAEGKKVIDVAIDAGYQPQSFLLEEKWLSSLEPSLERLLAAGCEFQVYIASRESLKKLAGYEVTRGALGAFRRKPLLTAQEVLAGSRHIAVLSGMTNAMNVGAIMRNAAALDIDGVLVDATCVDPLYRRALRSSMGCALLVPWARFGDLQRSSSRDEFFGLCDACGYETVACALDERANDIRATTFAPSAKVALLLGSEGEGLPSNVIERCSHRVMIPMARGVDSLNVASASAIAFWWLQSSGLP